MANYTLQQAQTDIAALRGQIAHILANAALANITVSGTISAATGGSWTQITPGGSWSNSGNNINGFFYRLLPTGDVQLAWDVTISSASPGTLGTLPSGFRPATTVAVPSGWYGTGPASYNDVFQPFLAVSSAGAITGSGLQVSGISLFGTFILPIGSL